MNGQLRVEIPYLALGGVPRRAPRGVLVAILEGCLAARTPPATARTPPRAFPSEYPQKPLWRHALGHNSTRVADVHDT